MSMSSNVVATFPNDPRGIIISSSCAPPTTTSTNVLISNHPGDILGAPITFTKPHQDRGVRPTVRRVSHASIDLSHNAARPHKNSSSNNKNRSYVRRYSATSDMLLPDTSDVVDPDEGCVASGGCSGMAMTTTQQHQQCPAAAPVQRLPQQPQSSSSWPAAPRPCAPAPAAHHPATTAPHAAAFHFQGLPALPNHKAVRASSFSSYDPSVAAAAAASAAATATVPAFLTGGGASGGLPAQQLPSSYHTSHMASSGDLLTMTRDAFVRCAAAAEGGDGSNRKRGLWGDDSDDVAMGDDNGVAGATMLAGPLPTTAQQQPLSSSPPPHHARNVRQCRRRGSSVSLDDAMEDDNAC